MSWLPRRLFYVSFQAKSRLTTCFRSQRKLVHRDRSHRYFHLRNVRDSYDLRGNLIMTFAPRSMHLKSGYVYNGPSLYLSLFLNVQIYMCIYSSRSFSLLASSCLPLRSPQVVRERSALLQVRPCVNACLRRDRRFPRSFTRPWLPVECALLRQFTTMTHFAFTWHSHFDERIATVTSTWRITVSVCIGCSLNCHLKLNIDRTFQKFCNILHASYNVFYY